MQTSWGGTSRLIVYCRTGNRSGLVADAMRPAGFDVSVLERRDHGLVRSWP